MPLFKSKRFEYLLILNTTTASIDNFIMARSYLGQEAHWSTVPLIFAKQFSFSDVICCVNVSKFSATMTANSARTFLSNPGMRYDIG